MDIYAKKGTKVRFSYPTSGLVKHQRTADNYLKLDTEYTLDYTCINSWHTNIFIKEVPGVAFNSVMFM